MTSGTGAIVTGAARGIGLAIAKRLAQAGHRVFAVDVVKDALDAAAKDCRAVGIEITPVVADLADPAAIAALPKAIGAEFNNVGVLVNNAGISPKTNGRKTPTDTMPLAEWELVMRVNLTAPVLMSQLVIPVMRANKFGRIINISSRAARMPSGVAGLHYVASKSALIGVSKVFAQDFAADGITVNAVAPGNIEGGMDAAIDPAKRAAIVAMIPVGRVGTPGDVAETVAFLASRAADFITGATIDVNGGVLMI